MGPDRIELATPGSVVRHVSAVSFFGHPKHMFAIISSQYWLILTYALIMYVQLYRGTKNS